MAKSDENNEVKTVKEVEKTAHGTTKSTANDTAVKKPLFTVPTLSTGWWVVVAGVGFFAVLGLFSLCFTAIHAVTNRLDDSTSTRGFSQMSVDRSGSFSQNGGMMRGQGMMGPRDDFSTDDSTSRVQGVVTAVDGQTITVAGNGTTTKVVVQDSTTYSGDEEPAKVNDTVMAYGTKDGDTLTATRVFLNRQ